LSIAILILGRVIPRLFYKGYIYDRYLFALALQLIEDARHIDPTILTKEEKELIVNQLKSIHNFGVLHNDISQKNILYEPKSLQFFFIDFGLSEIVDNGSPKLRKEEKRLKKLLQL
jgi:tRNA A-37 threonylcarbamoyl transferase component Bud32